MTVQDFSYSPTISNSNTTAMSSSSAKPTKTASESLTENFDSDSDNSEADVDPIKSYKERSANAALFDGAMHREDAVRVSGGEAPQRRGSVKLPELDVSGGSPNSSNSNSKFGVGGKSGSKSPDSSSSPTSEGSAALLFPNASKSSSPSSSGSLSGRILSSSDLHPSANSFDFSKTSHEQILPSSSRASYKTYDSLPLPVLSSSGQKMRYVTGFPFSQRLLMILYYHILSYNRCSRVVLAGSGMDRGYKSSAFSKW
jgi:hypothetical protein